MGACPAADALSDLAAGKLPPAVAAGLHHHVRGCEGCAAALAAIGAESDGGPADESLGPGDRVGRFELIDLLGMGSMGAVWSARDTDLGRVVALKTLRPVDNGASDPSALKRLLREAQAMALLSHPNVVTVHEVVARGEQIFLAMERVGGGTLREWLSARARPLDEVLGVFVEAGKGLAAAHAAGLVHRDFKPDNVLVGEDGRVRVTDFGLARPAGAARPAASSPDPPPAVDLTRSGALVGTPAYMAPEQMRGEPIDARADVFGFCTSLYEAVYGVRPFAGANLDELRKSAEANRLTPPQPGRGAPPWLRRLLVKGLRAAPGERWASMDALLAAIAESRARSARRPLVLALVAAVAAAAALALWLGPRRGVQRPQAAGPRRSVAVLGPRNDSGRPESAWLSTALADMMVSELAASEDLRLVPESNVARAVADFGLPRAQDPAAADLARLRTALGADLVLAGSFAAPAAGSLRLDLRLYDARTGELTAGVSEAGMPARLFELVAQAGVKLRGALRAAPPASQEAPSASYPRDPEAERLYAEGLDALRRYEPGAAARALGRAAEL
ncbi:MAG TPA: serine/threonine-protein kinase, partial [Myxococcales bacterium]|nr:serine/threonine-protein kinase [Myxococcales bacterium]